MSTTLKPTKPTPKPTQQVTFSQMTLLLLAAVATAMAPSREERSVNECSFNDDLSAPILTT